MAHLWQAHFGKPGRTSYHNKQWAGMMEAIGLIPSDTGAPGGKQTGQKVSHYIAGGGPFDKACRALIEQGFVVRYVELWSDPEARRKKAASKTKYTCLSCGLNAWGKPDDMTFVLRNDARASRELADALIADKAFAAEERVLRPFARAGKTAVIPPEANRKEARAYDKDLYKARHLIENFFAKLKQYRAIATRYDKRAVYFLGAIHLAAAAAVWLN